MKQLASENVVLYAIVTLCIYIYIYIVLSLNTYKATPTTKRQKKTLASSESVLDLLPLTTKQTWHFTTMLPGLWESPRLMKITAWQFAKLNCSSARGRAIVA